MLTHNRLAHLEATVDALEARTRAPYRLTIVDNEMVERPVGSVFCLIRRAALNAPYVTDYETCLSVARAGYRYGWSYDVRAYHLGWDDYKLYPAHLASKLEHGGYREVELIER